ncbi:hypothetical protein BD324DRAFT_401467 [Kockovaella imperatae]|uniref:Uncharacterized protein n=1 Tax=Kockovaella imperatae TaxID=4999 RepID=A0A1Y1UID2_9TREE|nr:hypothetical protein BD324DRAFT_401467 [Kockovaella imperatae]ORX37813.1 hypothetical protein BD324DRAFT_401467 [Kockovaella imperatae]
MRMEHRALVEYSRVGSRLQTCSHTAVPSVPIKRAAVRVRPDETPSHGGGLSDTARERLEAYRKSKNMPSTSTASSTKDREGERQQGLGDFQSRLNRVSHGERRRDDRDDRDSRNGSSSSQGSGERRDDWAGVGSSSRGNRGREDGGSMRVPNRGWDETPSRGPGGWGKSSDPRRGMGWDQTPRSSRDSRETEEEMEMNAKEWEEEQVRLDRDWYNYDDEGAVAGDEEHNPFAQWENLESSKEQELEAKAVKRQTARQAQFNADNDLWETNRMQQSGVAARQGVDSDFDDDQDSKVHVLVHDLKPPFLDGTVAYTKQLEPINPIRDPTSDLAIFSKKGSALVRERRERQEREKAAAKAASIAGTTLGNILGIKDEPDLGEEGQKVDEI